MSSAESDSAFAGDVAAQVALLNAGKPLEAIDAWFDDAIEVFANDSQFASSAAEARAKQEPFMSRATSIAGDIRELNIDSEKKVCVFRNHTRFVDADGSENKIDGLSWQRWKDRRVVEERYYDGAFMEALVSDGLLSNPRMLLLE